MVDLNFGKRLARIFPPIVLFILFLSVENFSQSPLNLQSGTYWDGSAKIGIDGAYISGTIDRVIGENANAVCQFYFSGELSGNHFKIKCRTIDDSESVSGTLTAQDDSSFILKTDDEPGCSVRIADFVDSGKEMILQTKSDFIQIRVVKSTKAYFYKQPNLKSKRKAYLVLGDEIQVTEKQNGWLKATYKKTSGWMLNEDMFPLSVSK